MISAESLLKELSSYVADGDLERASLERVRRLLSETADSFTRDNPDHITGSTIVARPDGSAFLLVNHRRLGRWLQPGGHTEPEDASVLATALREAREETGVVALDLPLGGKILDLDVHEIPASRDRPAHVHYDLRYLATTRENPAHFAVDEVRGVAWFTLEEALASGADESLARALRKARSLL